MNYNILIEDGTIQNDKALRKISAMIKRDGVTVGGLRIILSQTTNLVATKAKLFDIFFMSADPATREFK